jgi:hypothetical protein
MARIRKPTTDEVQNLLRRIPTPQLRRAFFERLNNPFWVAALNSAGQFSNPPEPIED